MSGTHGCAPSLSSSTTCTGRNPPSSTLSSTSPNGRGRSDVARRGARPELLDHRSDWGGGKLNATSILLEPLTDAESERLIENLLGHASVAEEPRARIKEAAEGNPLFVEEMLSMLIDDGLLRRENGRWRSTADLAKISMPSTIQALLAARLDRLEHDERVIIERAAVEGKVFHVGAVSALAASSPARRRRRAPDDARSGGPRSPLPPLVSR